MRNSKGFTLIELLIVVAIIGIVAAIAVPGLMNARQSGNETSAIGSLGAINKAQAAYSATCGKGGFATDLADLYKAPDGGTPFIGPDLKENDIIKSGYKVSLAEGTDAEQVADSDATCNDTESKSSYFATADPMSNSGRRHFATDGRATVFESSETMADSAAMDSDGRPIQ